MSDSEDSLLYSAPTSTEKNTAQDKPQHTPQNTAPKKSKKALFCFLVIMLFALLWVYGFALFKHSSNAHFSMSDPSKLPRSEAAIVLTGGAKRIEEALKLVLADKVQSVLISGVHKSANFQDILNKTSFTTAQKKYFKHHCCINLDYKAATTQENALEAEKWVAKNRIRSVILVTSDYHMKRSALEFGERLPKNLVLSYYAIKSDVSAQNKTRTFFLNVSEYHKFLFIRMKILMQHITDKVV